MLIIRKAKHGDAAVISEILCTSIRELCVFDHKDDPRLIRQWTANKTPSDISRGLFSTYLDFFLAEYDGQPAGIGCISDDGELLLNYVAPINRFCGISRAVLAHAEAALSEKGFGKAKLTSTETAYTFYLSAGWSDCGEPEVAFGIKGYPMEKILKGSLS